MDKSGCIAVLNAGSSSIKFAIYDAHGDGAELFHGQVEGIGTLPRLQVNKSDGTVVATRDWADSALDHHGATAEIMSVGRELLAGRHVLAFGHRVVHGGTAYAAP